MNRLTLLSALAALLAPLAAPAALAQDDAPPAERKAAVEIPETHAGRLLEWFLRMTSQPSIDAIAPELGESLNDMPMPHPQVFVSEFQVVRLSTKGLEPVRIREIDALELDVLLRAREGGEWWFATVGADSTPPHKLVKLSTKPLVQRPNVAVTDWADLSWSFDQRRERVMSLIVEEVQDGRVRPKLRLNRETRGAIAQASRLFPIVAVAEEIVAGRLELDEPVQLDRSLRTLGGDTLRSVEPGQPVTVGELLGLAAAGDNEAVDQLIGLLGRGAVERVAAEIQGPDSPNLPFITTGEFFKLKMLSENDPVYRSYVEAATEDDRRLALVDLLERSLPTYEEADAVRTPSRVLEVEWMASPDELTALLERLDAAIRADESGELAHVLNEVSPLNREMGVWKFVFRVSGGEPGVLAEAAIAERIDGKRFRFALVVDNPDREIDFSFFGSLPPLIMTHLALEE